MLQILRPSIVVEFVNYAVKWSLVEERRLEVDTDQVDAMKVGVVDQRRPNHITLFVWGKSVAYSKAIGGWRIRSHGYCCRVAVWNPRK